MTLAATNSDGPACSALRDEGDESKDVELRSDGTRSKRRRPGGDRWQMAGWWFTWELGWWLKWLVIRVVGHFDGWQIFVAWWCPLMVYPHYYGIFVHNVY